MQKNTYFWVHPVLVKNQQDILFLPEEHALITFILNFTSTCMYIIIITYTTKITFYSQIKFHNFLSKIKKFSFVEKCYLSVMIE